jgi:recombinational DNA repair ATPase RecF
MTQGTFQSFTDPNSSNYKSPEERKQYIDEQIAQGNPKYTERNTWLKENADKIRISKLEAQVNEILAKLPK